MTKKKTITDEAIDEMIRTLKKFRVYRDRDRSVYYDTTYAAAKRAGLDLRYKLIEWEKLEK